MKGNWIIIDERSEMKLSDLIKLKSDLSKFKIKSGKFKRKSDDEYFDDIDLCSWLDHIRSLVEEDFLADDWEIIDENS